MKTALAYFDDDDEFGKIVEDIIPMGLPSSYESEPTTPLTTPPGRCVTCGKACPDCASVEDPYDPTLQDDFESLMLNMFGTTTAEEREAWLRVVGATTLSERSIAKLKATLAQMEITSQFLSEVVEENRVANRTPEQIKAELRVQERAERWKRQGLT